MSLQAITAERPPRRRRDWPLAATGSATSSSTRRRRRSIRTGKARLNDSWPDFGNRSAPRPRTSGSSTSLESCRWPAPASGPCGHGTTCAHGRAPRCGWNIRSSARCVCVGKLAISGTAGQVLVAYHADPSSPDADKLRLLGFLVQARPATRPGLREPPQGGSPDGSGQEASRLIWLPTEERDEKRP